jgi:MYXO-CTERM domain-containing protein
VDRVFPRALACGLAAFAVSAAAQASNGTTPRTPPVFEEQACLRVVDRSVDPVFHVDFAIPFEDVDLTPDEPIGARTFQFFGICRDRHADERLPNWIDQADVDLALDSGALRQAPESGDVLDGHPDYDIGHDGAAGSCVQTINAAADRIPISCAATAGAVDWDTSGAPAGNYVVHGYTFAPAVNLWTPRLGLVRIHDGDPAALGPAVALTSPEGDASMFELDGFAVVGCVAGAAGTTVSVQWSKIADDLDDDASWTPICDDVEAADGAFGVTFWPPPAAVNQAIVVRALATDPQGRQWLAHAPGKLLVFPGAGRSDGPEVPPGPDFCGAYPGAVPFGADPGPSVCRDGDATGDDSTSDDGSADGTTAATTEDGGETGSSGASDAPDTGGQASGCGCRGGGEPPPAAWLWVALIALTGVGRRQRAVAHTAAIADSSPVPRR